MNTGITIVGCGPGGAEYMTGAGLSSVYEAELLVGVPRLLEMFPGVEAERIALSGNFEEVLDNIAAHAGRKKITVLVTGDPGLYSLARTVIKKFGRAACRVIPGISSVQTAFARLALDWNDARIISAHAQDPGVDLQSLAARKKIAVLAGGERSRPWLQSVVRALGDQYMVFVCSNLTLENEKVDCIPAASLAGVPLPSRSIVLFVRKEELS